jgi:serine protease
VRFDLSGGGGDADMYIRFKEKATLTQYDCRPYKIGNAESCLMSARGAGTWYVTLRAYTAYSGVSLKASADVGSAAPCEGCRRYAGGLAGRSAFVYVPASSYLAAKGTQEFWLSGPASADFDLFLYKLTGGIWVKVASAEKASSSEKLTYYGDAGTYRLSVYAYSGSGQFELWMKP